METDGDQSGQQGAPANGSAAPGASSRPSPMNSMSLYERQAVQALQALQRQPNAAQYFQQLMLQQQINNAQLHNLAAVQQATLAASRQSSPSSSTSSQSTITTTAANVTTSGGASVTRPIGQGVSATSTISQSVLLSGTAGAQGQMYLRVNRSLRAPISSQLIFMPGSTATAAVAVTQQQQQQQQQQQPQQDVTPPTSSGTGSQSDNDQVQNLAMRGGSAPKVVGVKTEAPEKSDSAPYALTQPTSTPQSPTKPAQPAAAPPQPQLAHIKIPTYPQPSSSSLKPPHHQHHHLLHTSSSSSSSSASIPLSQLLLHGPRALTTVTTTAGGTATHATHILVPAAASSNNNNNNAGIKPAGIVGGGGHAQTLVVQPLQKAALCAPLAPPDNTPKPAAHHHHHHHHHHGNGPVPIQPKTLQGLRLPLQLPSRNPPPILPAPPPPPPPPSGMGAPPPHIPVQIVGARQSSLGINGQALALAQARIDAAAGTGAVPVSTTAYSSVLSGSSSLLTMVASIASREAAASVAQGRGAALKALHQEALSSAQVSHVHPQANQNASVCPGHQNGALSSAHPPVPPSSSSSSLLSRASLTLPLVVEEHRGGGASAVANGEAVTSQGKQTAGSLKRKLESNSANGEDGPSPAQLQPIRAHPSVLSSNAIEATNHSTHGPGVVASPSPPPPPPPGLCVSRVGGGQTERAPPPQAVVKPHVLTHLIEGFVIQEGAEPFPVCGPVKEPAGEDLTDSPDTNQSESVTTATVLKCEYCKKFAPAAQFRGTKRFCSMTCAKRYNVSCSQHFRMRQTSQGHQGHGQGHQGHGPDHQGHEGHRHHHHHHHHHLSASDEEGGGGGGGVARRRVVPRRTSSEIASAKIAGRPLPSAKCRSESSRSSMVSSGEEEEELEEEEEEPMSFSPASSVEAPPPPPCEGDAPSFLPSSPAQWSVEEVSQFISSLQGCEELSCHFLSQEIDGQALMLLREEHLMTTMSIKLGPALKICAHINDLRPL